MLLWLSEVTCANLAGNLGYLCGETTPPLHTPTTGGCEGRLSNWLPRLDLTTPMAESISILAHL